MLIRACAAAVFMLMAGGAVADAAEDKLDYHGRTSQKKRVKVESSKEGAVRELAIVWSATDCDRARGFVRSGTVLQFNPDPVQPAIKLDLQGKYNQRFDEGITGIMRTRGKARLSDDRERWSGTFRVVAALRADGRQVDKCKTPLLRWTAPLLERDYVATGGLDVQSDPGSSVGDGESESLPVSSGGGSVKVFDRGRTLNFGVGTWSGNLAVDSGRLTPGDYTAGVDGASLSIRGHSNGCDDAGITGTFTITTFVFRGDLVRAADFAFEQYCYSETDAVRGTVTYRFDPPPLGGGLGALPTDTPLNGELTPQSARGVRACGRSRSAGHRT